MDELPGCVVVHPRTGEKMSEILEEFAQPLLAHAQSDEEIRKALGMATIAWNCAIAPPDARREFEQLIHSKFEDSVMRDVFDFLIARKHALFPENKRMILDYDMDRSTGQLALNVVSTFSPGAAGAWLDRLNGDPPTGARVS